MLRAPSLRRPAMVLGYGAMLAACVLVFLWLRRVAPPGPATGHVAAPLPRTPDVLLHVLLALAAILVAARALGAVFGRLRQPPVIGEVVAGILLGPSLLGHLWPAGFAFLMPPSIAPFLQVIAQVGVILYMFVVGLELDPSELRRHPQAAVLISHASIVVPFLSGAALALALYPAAAGPGVAFTPFALFLGVSMSVTAFPVLARILTDRRLQRTHLGVLALTCAAVDDVTAWCLLAFVTAVAAHRGDALPTVLLTAAFIVVVLVGVRPLLARLARRADAAPDGTPAAVLTTVFVLLLLAAIATEWIGIHALFGAFLLGVALPHDSRLARDLTTRMHDVVVMLLLPAFFAYSGLRTQIGLLHGAGAWLTCGAIVLVACVGKFGGSALAARQAGLPWRTAAAIGTLMNTRGLVELIVLNVGLDLGVIGPPLFTMLVIMALVTTFATSPVLDGLLRGAAHAVAPAGVARGTRG